MANDNRFPLDVTSPGPSQMLGSTAHQQHRFPLSDVTTPKPSDMHVGDCRCPWCLKWRFSRWAARSGGQ